MKNWIRNWLGITTDGQTIDKNFLLVGEDLNDITLSMRDMFNTLPFAMGVMSLTASNAALLTLPEGAKPNDLSAILTRIIMAARNGDSSLQLEGTISDDLRKNLTNRGFKIEDVQGAKETGVFVLWT